MAGKKDRSNYFRATPEDFIFSNEETTLSPAQIKEVSKVLVDKGLFEVEVSDEILEQAGINLKKMSSEQIINVFNKLDEKGLLKAESPDKKAKPTGAQGTGRKGLVKKKVTVKRGGKTFQQERWVKAGEDEVVDKPKKGEDEAVKKPGETEVEEKPEKKSDDKTEPKNKEGLIIQGLNKDKNKEEK